MICGLPVPSNLQIPRVWVRSWPRALVSIRTKYRTPCVAWRAAPVIPVDAGVGGGPRTLLESMPGPLLDKNADRGNSSVGADDAVDAHVRAYTEITRRLDALVILPGGVEETQAWRLAAERNQRSTGAPGMTDDEVRDFMRRYLPTYERYLPKLQATSPVAHTLRL